MHMCQNCTTGKVDQAQIDISVLCRVWSLVHQSSKIEEIFTCASAPAEPLCPQVTRLKLPGMSTLPDPPAFRPWQKLLECLSEHNCHHWCLRQHVQKRLLQPPKQFCINH
eukprot:scaffold238930_cov18-Tisochrysis_lutea.AAC.1